MIRISSQGEELLAARYELYCMDFVTYDSG